MLDEILQRIDEGNGLPEKTLKIETQSHIDDTDIHSRPDGLISCNYAFNIYIESKLSDVINLTQLENHKKLIVEDRDERNKRLRCGSPWIAHQTCQPKDYHRTVHVFQ